MSRVNASDREQRMSEDTRLCLSFVLGMVFMTLAHVAVLWAARPTPSEQITECQSIMRLDNEHTDTE